jgi:pantothenate kinase
MQVEIGIDLGGTLVKVLFMTKFAIFEEKVKNFHSISWKLKTLKSNVNLKNPKILLNNEINYLEQKKSGKTQESGENSNKIFFYYFLEPRSDNDSNTIQSIFKQLDQEKFSIQLGLTGGGAKSLELDLENGLLDILKIELKKINEMNSIVDGLEIIQKYFPSHFLSINEIGNPLLSSKDKLYPLTLINIGSGSSVVYINEDKKFCRVGGTCIGASTFLGLSVLSNCSISNELFSVPKNNNFSHLINNALIFFESLEMELDLKSLQKELDSTEFGAFELHMLVNILRENIRMGFYGAISKKCNRVILSGSIFCILTDFDQRFHKLMKNLIKIVVDGTCLEMEVDMQVMVLQSSGLLGAFSSLK